VIKRGAKKRNMENNINPSKYFNLFLAKKNKPAPKMLYNLIKMPKTIQKEEMKFLFDLINIYEISIVIATKVFV
jgi:hypothetical protein